MKLNRLIGIETAPEKAERKWDELTEREKHIAVNALKFMKG